jgi:hypothetical protein
MRMDITRIEMTMLEPRRDVFVGRTGEYIYEKDLLLVEFGVETYQKGCPLYISAQAWRL